MGGVHVFRRILPAAAILVVIILVALLSEYSLLRGGSPQEKTGVVVAVTFYSLKPDLDLLVCSGDSVFSVTPPGVDPHEYQLTPSGVDNLRRADIIISTAHAPFEVQIRDLVSRGEIRAILVEIPSIPGIKILNNPATGQPNYHWPLYDPENYKLYMTYVEAQLEKLRPACAKAYRQNLEKILSSVAAVESNTEKLDLCAVASSPTAQYAVEWAGVRVKYLLIKEHDLPATPEDIARIENSLKSGECRLVVIAGPTETPLAKKAIELASKYNVPYILVPHPTSPESTLNKILKVSQELTKLATTG
ncbi:metal ABC transporter substrate-binding protein [Infirmifilum lucidum]|uniref:Metal ABC transporter substrate-binding protein n=1 Tax=Infirmifilum lucidum TaxID=2776706 RepID=A0A7L9FHV0_9CREN|nr:zinc ABC transporter substrate-binding protein [Infirmifilum lucidum]QOJ78484.1 metal ABC transporter substrate-binding protein [Infirmifilum lucidum]